MAIGTQSLLLFCAHHGYTQLVASMLVDERWEWDPSLKVARRADGASPIYLACANNNLSIVRHLARAGAPFEPPGCPGMASNGWLPLHVATSFGHFDIVNYLVKDEGADANAPDLGGYTPIHLAAAGGHVSCIRVLVQCGGDVNAQTPVRDNSGGGTALHQACANGNTQVVRTLLDLGAKIGQGTQDGRTPLIIACDNGHEGVVEAILVAAAAQTEESAEDENSDDFVDVNATTVAGKTALYMACEKGHAQIAAQLINAGADVSKPTSRRKIPLYTAVEQFVVFPSGVAVAIAAAIAVVISLMVIVVDLCVTKAPLPSLRDRGNVEMVKLLLPHSRKDDLFFETTYGTTPLFIANKQGNQQIKDLLMHFTRSFMAAEKRNWEAGFKPEALGTVGRAPEEK